MAKDIDRLLTALATAPGPDAPARLEADVFARIRERREDAAFGSLPAQFAVAVAALVLGVVVAGATLPREPVRSEMIVLSEDAGLAPSVAIEGGA